MAKKIITISREFGSGGRFIGEEVAKKLGSDGRILVRESGTEPLIRVMVEAGTDELCLENVDHVVKVMESEGLLID